MRRALVVSCLLVLGARTAAAEPVSLGGYAEPSLLAGVRSLHGVEDGEYTIDRTGGVFGLRLTLGLRVAEGAGRVWRLGGALDIPGGAVEGGFFGVEASVDWPVAPRWRLGPRVALGIADDGDGGEGVHVGAGVTARHGKLIVGLDASGGPSYFRGTGPEAGFDGHAWGVVSRVGVGGRPGLYTEIAIVGLSLLYAAALSGVDSH